VDDRCDAREKQRDWRFGQVRSCVRPPKIAVRMTAGHDEIRGLGPDHFDAPEEAQ
jgi:hypothetical protein